MIKYFSSEKKKWVESWDHLGSLFVLRKDIFFPALGNTKLLSKAARCSVLTTIVGAYGK